VGSVPLVAGPQARALVWSRLCSFGRRGLIHFDGWPIGKGVVMFSPLYLWLVSAHTLWWRAERQGRCSGLVSVRWSAWAQSCGSGPIGKGVGMVSRLFLCSAWAQSQCWQADSQPLLDQVPRRRNTRVRVASFYIPTTSRHRLPLF
jgi:hypothetical protein